MDPQLCREYSEHTWRKDVCRNCLNSQSTHNVNRSNAKPTKRAEKLDNSKATRQPTDANLNGLSSETRPCQTHPIHAAKVESANERRTKNTDEARSNNGYSSNRSSKPEDNDVNEKNTNDSNPATTRKQKVKVDVLSKINGYEKKTPIPEAVVRQNISNAGTKVKDKDPGCDSTGLFNRLTDLESIPINYSCKVIQKETNVTQKDNKENLLVNRESVAEDTSKFSCAYSYTKLDSSSDLPNKRSAKNGILRIAGKRYASLKQVEFSASYPVIIGYNGGEENSCVDTDPSHATVIDDVDLYLTPDDKKSISLVLFNTKWNSELSNLSAKTDKQVSRRSSHEFEDVELLSLWQTRRFSNLKHCDNRSPDAGRTYLASRNSSQIRTSLENLFDKISDDSLLSSIIDGFSTTSLEFDDKATTVSDGGTNPNDMASKKSSCSTPVMPFQVKVSDQRTCVASAYKVVDITHVESAKPYGIVDVTSDIPQYYPMPGIPGTPAPSKTGKQVRTKILDDESEFTTFAATKEARSVVEEMLKDKASDAELKAAIKLLDDVWKDEESSLTDSVITMSPKPKPREISMPTVPDAALYKHNDSAAQKSNEGKSSIYDEAILCGQSSSSDSCESKLSFTKGKGQGSASQSSTDGESSADQKAKGKRFAPSAPSIPPPHPPQESPKRSNSINEEVSAAMNFSPIPEPTFRFVKTGGMGGFQPRPPTPDAGIYSPKLEDIEPTPLPTEFNENYGTMTSVGDQSKQTADPNSGGGIISFFSKFLRRGREGSLSDEATVSTNDMKLVKSSALQDEEGDQKKNSGGRNEQSSKRVSKDTARRESDSLSVEDLTAFDRISGSAFVETMKSSEESESRTKISGSVSPKVAPRARLSSSDASQDADVKLAATLPKDASLTDKVVMRNRQFSPKIVGGKPSDAKGDNFTRELEMRLSKNIADRSSTLQDRSREHRANGPSPPESPGGCRDDRPLSMPPNMAPLPPTDPDLYLPPWESKACEKIELPQCLKARRSILGRITVSKKSRPVAPPPSTTLVPVKRTRSISDAKLGSTEISAPIPMDVPGSALDPLKTVSLLEESSSSGCFSCPGNAPNKSGLNDSTVPRSPFFPDNQYEPVLPVEPNKSSALKVPKCPEGYLEPVDAKSIDRQKIGQAMTLDRQRLGQGNDADKTSDESWKSQTLCVERSQVGKPKVVVQKLTDDRQKVVQKLESELEKRVKKSPDLDGGRGTGKKDAKKEASKKEALKKESAKKIAKNKDGSKSESSKVEKDAGKSDAKGGSKAEKVSESGKVVQGAKEREMILACQPIYEEIPGSYDDLYFTSTKPKCAAKPDTPPKLPGMSPQLNMRSQTLPRNVANRSHSLTASDRPVQTLQRPKVKPDIPKTLPNRGGVMDRSFHESPIRGAKPVVAPKRPISEAPKDPDKSPQERAKPEVPQTVPNRPKPIPRKKPQSSQRPLVDQYVPIARPGSSFWCVPEEQIRESFQHVAETCFECLQHMLREYDQLLFHNDPVWKNNDLRWKDFEIILENNKLAVPGAVKAKLAGSKPQTLFHLMPLQCALPDNLFKISHLNWLRVVATFSDNIPASFIPPGSADSTSTTIAVTQYTAFSSLSHHFMALQELHQINSNKYCQQFIFALIQIFSAVSYYLEHAIPFPDIGLQDVSVASIRQIGGKFIVIWPKVKPAYMNVDGDENVCGIARRVVQEMVLSFLSIDRKLPARYELTMDVVNHMLGNDTPDCFPVARSVLELCVWGPSDDRLRDFMSSDAPEQSLDLWLETERFGLVNRYAKTGVSGGMEATTVSELYRLKFLLKSSGAGLVQVAGLLVKLT